MMNQKPGYEDMIQELMTKFPLSEPTIIGEQNQKDFIALFGAILRMRNLLSSFDEFAGKELKRFFGSRNGRIDKVYGQIQKEERSLLKSQIHIEPLPYDFSVCKVEDYSQVDLSAPFTFPQRTDEENSLVCLTENVPANTTEREDGWNAFRIKGTLDFSLIGILSGIATVLAGNTIGIFAISTYNTDYILVKKTDFQKTIDVLKQKGYTVDD